MTNRKQASPKLWPKKQATKEKQGDSKKPKYKKYTKKHKHAHSDQSQLLSSANILEQEW